MSITTIHEKVAAFNHSFWIIFSFNRFKDLNEAFGQQVSLACIVKKSWPYLVKWLNTRSIRF